MHHHLFRANASAPSRRRHRRGLRLATLPIAVLGVMGLATPATAAPQGPACGSTLTESITLTKNLRCTGDGLVLGNGVTLDLGGYQLVGTGAGVGVTMSPEGSSSVTNGTIKNFELGLNAEGLDVSVDANVEAVKLISADLSASYAVHLTITDSSLIDSPINVYTSSVSVRGSTLTRSRLWTFYGGADVADSTFVASGVNAGGSGTISVSGSKMDGRGSGNVGSCSEATISITGSVVKNYRQGISGYYCAAILTNNKFTNIPDGVVSDISGGFIDSTPYTQIVGNTFSYSGTVLRTGAMIVQGNTFTNNTTGVVFLNPEGSRATGNTFMRNSDSGIYTDGSGLTVGGNKAVNNGRYGIYAPDAVDLGGNVAYGNKVAQCVGLTCASRS